MVIIRRTLRLKSICLRLPDCKNCNKVINVLHHLYFPSAGQHFQYIDGARYWHGGRPWSRLHSGVNFINTFLCASFFVRKCFTQLFSSYSLILIFLALQYQCKSCSYYADEINHRSEWTDPQPWSVRPRLQHTLTRCSTWQIILPAIMLW